MELSQFQKLVSENLFLTLHKNEMGVESLQASSSSCSPWRVLVLQHKGSCHICIALHSAPFLLFPGVFRRPLQVVSQHKHPQDLISFLERGVTTGVSVAVTETDDLPYISICPKPPLK